MNWGTRIGVLVVLAALVGATTLAIHEGRSGTPATTVLATSPPQLADVTSVIAPDSCALTPAPGTGGDTVVLGGACTGTLPGAADCGDATGNVAWGAVAPTAREGTLSVLVQFDEDPLTAGPASASVFVEYVHGGQFDRWSDRSAVVDVDGNGDIPFHSLALTPEAGTGAGPIVLSGTAHCAPGS
ncbi:MAG TPA: hypothetical protein VMB82_10425 [Acidimicrobiales bacterium]|nr:hypothetical protein [Acidimicrobiales bacterium]